MSENEHDAGHAASSAVSGSATADQKHARTIGVTCHARRLALMKALAPIPQQRTQHIFNDATGPRFYLDCHRHTRGKVHRASVNENERMVQSNFCAVGWTVLIVSVDGIFRDGF